MKEINAQYKSEHHALEQKQRTAFRNPTLEVNKSESGHSPEKEEQVHPKLNTYFWAKTYRM
jgi:hypothetical protein